MVEIIGHIVALVLSVGASGMMVLLVVMYINAFAEQRKPKRPKNIEVYAGHCMSGKCPRCGAAVTNCDGKEVGAMSFCPCCGRKIQFPKHKAIDGVKSVSADEYLKGVKRK